MFLAVEKHGKRGFYGKNKFGTPIAFMFNRIESEGFTISISRNENLRTTRFTPIFLMFDCRVIARQSEARPDHLRLSRSSGFWLFLCASRKTPVGLFTG
jgi:hypothetical protein